jgi:DNA-binding GntR family transcriptional regulator
MNELPMQTASLSIEESGRPAHHAPLRQAAYDSIEDLLNNGALKPGSVVSQRELVDRIGATLGAVREAIPRLEAEGLLVTLPKRGLMVPSLDVTFVRDAYQMRAMIEATAASVALKTIPRSVFQDLIARHEAAGRQLRQTGDPDLPNQIQRFDWAMHAQFVEAMGNTLINNVYRVTAIKIRMAVQSRIRVTSDNAFRIINEHLVFLKAFAAGDEASAIALLKKHIENSQTIALGGTVDTPPDPSS